MSETPDTYDVDDLLTGLTPTWRDEYRVTGMTFRRGSRTLTESSGTVPAGAGEAPEVYAMMERLRESRGGTIQHRRVIETEWADCDGPVPIPAADGADR